MPDSPLRVLLLTDSCKELTDKAIADIAANCPLLTQLEVNKATNLTDKSLDSIGRGRTSRLRVFGLMCNTNIREEAVQQMCSRRRHIQTLKLVGCNKMSTDAVRSLRRNFTVII